MKKLLFFAAILFFAANVQAQQIVKLGIGSLTHKAINLEYERVLTNNTSILAEVSYQIPMNFPDKLLDWGQDEGSANKLVFSDGKLRNTFVAAEYRIYTGGEAPKGFYIAPCVKLSRYSFDMEGTYTNNTNGNFVSASADGTLFTASLGGQVGYQWVIQDNLTINWSFLGLGVGLNRVKAGFTANDTNVFDSFAEDVRTYTQNIPGLKQIDLISDNLNKRISGSGGFVFPTTRVSVSVGYMF